MLTFLSGFIQVVPTGAENTIVGVVASLVLAIIGFLVKNSRDMVDCRENSQNSLDSIKEVLKGLEANATVQTNLLDRIDKAQERVERDVDKIAAGNPCVLSNISSAKAITDTIADEIVGKIK
jgi:hypothetical protein